MKVLNGIELAGFIKERQAKQVRSLRQSWRVFPKLAIIRSSDDPVIDSYVRLKRSYGHDIGVEVIEYKPSSHELMAKIDELNRDESVHGIIIQLPLLDKSQIDMAVNAVVPEKDVDGLGKKTTFMPATAMAIDWLLAGYNVELSGKEIVIVGKGRLVGAPLAKLWKDSGFNVSICDSKTTNMTDKIKQAEILVTATGVPGLITGGMLRKNAVVVDAGTASEDSKIIGDVDDSVREREDLTITPIKGGVGPLTVAALLDNIILAARKVAEAKGRQDI